MDKHLGILFVGTGKYISLFDDFHRAFSKHWCKEVRRTFFVFSDNVPRIESPDVVHLPTPQESWPYPTLHRYDYFLRHAGSIGQCTHLMFANANLRPITDIFFEELFDGTNTLFGTIHPGFAFAKKNWRHPYPGTFETNKRSTAYVGRQPRIYYAGGLNGGTTEAWLRLSGYLSENILMDKQHNVNGTGWAIWHDESHINHYFNCHQSPKALGPEYLYPEGRILPVPKKVVVLEKARMGGHDYLRGVQALPAAI